MLLRISLIFAFLGLFLTWFFSPNSLYEKRSIKQALENCTGFVEIQGFVESSYKKTKWISVVSSAGYKINVVSSEPFIKKQEVTLKGKLSKFSGKCWLYVD